MSQDELVDARTLPWPDYGEWREPKVSYGDEVDSVGYVSLPGEGPRRVTEYIVSGVMDVPGLGALYVTVKGFAEVPASLSWHDAHIALEEAIKGQFPHFQITESGIPYKDDAP